MVHFHHLHFAKLLPHPGFCLGDHKSCVLLGQPSTASGVPQAKKGPIGLLLQLEGIPFRSCLPTVLVAASKKQNIVHSDSMCLISSRAWVKFCRSWELKLLKTGDPTDIPSRPSQIVCVSQTESGGVRLTAPPLFTWVSKTCGRILRASNCNQLCPGGKCTRGRPYV